jgi:hypothetical protein
MLTWRERIERRKLRKELRRLQKVYGPDLKKSKGDDYERLLAEFFSESDFVQGPLHAIETNALQRMAHKWDVEVPPQSDERVWSRDFMGEYYLNDAAAIRIRREVRRVRREAVKWWVDLLVPLLSLLVALAAVLSPALLSQPCP